MIFPINLKCCFKIIIFNAEMVMYYVFRENIFATQPAIIKNSEINICIHIDFIQAMSVAVSIY